MTGQGGGPRVSAIVVTYDTDLGDAEACVEALRAQTLPPAEVIVVDNSPDGRFASHFAGRDLTILEHPDNPGFTGGTWSGAQAASGELLFFVNPDALALPDCLEALARALADDAAVVIAGAQILLPDGTVNAGEAPVHFSGLAWCGNYRGVAERGDAREAFAVSGCAFLVRSATFRQFNGFRERFEMYYDDTDLCWRTHIAGLKTLFVPRARVVHAYEDREAYRWRWVERNRLLMVLTNFERRTLLVLLPGLIVTEVGSWFMAVTGGWWKYKALAYWQVASRPGWLWREGGRVRASRRVTDSAILRRLKFELDTPGRPQPVYLRVVNGCLRRYAAWVYRVVPEG